MSIFFLHLLMYNISSLACWWYVTLIDFEMLNEPCIFGLNLGCGASFFLYIVGFDFLLFNWRFLHLWSWERLVCSFSFFVIPCLVLAFGLMELIKKYPLYLTLLEEVIENWHNFFLKCLVEFTNGIQSSTFCFGRNYWFNLI